MPTRGRRTKDEAIVEPGCEARKDGDAVSGGDEGLRPPVVTDWPADG